MCSSPLLPKPDLHDEPAIRLLVDTFYQKVLSDSLLAPVFQDIAKINIQHHLPVMYSFWGSLLLGTATYHGAPFPKHAALRQHLTPRHFTRWLELFEETIDEHFSGKCTEHARHRARSIAHVFQAKMGIAPPQ